MELLNKAAPVQTTLGLDDAEICDTEVCDAEIFPPRYRGHNTKARRSNALTRALKSKSIVSRQKPQSIWEERIVICILVYLDSFKFTGTEKSIPPIEIDRKLLGINENTNSSFEHISKACKSLLTSVRYMQDGATQQFDGFTYFSRISYSRGVVKVKINNEIIPHLLGLKREYTEIEYSTFKELQTTNGQSLYAYLKSWMNSKTPPECSIDELYRYFGATKTQASAFAIFNKQVLQPGIADIEEHTDMRVKLEFTKTGRKYSGVIFHISKISAEEKEKLEKKQQLQKEKKKQESEQKLIESIRACILNGACEKKPNSKKCRLCASTVRPDMERVMAEKRMLEAAV